VNLSLAAFEGYMLVGFWKALIILVPFVAWAWFVSSVLDKHAARFFLPRERWNLIHLVAGLVALALVLGMPIQTEWGFWVGLAAMLAVLAMDVGAYVVVSSRDERVPEEHHIRLDLSSWKQARAEKAVAKQQGTVELTIRNPAGKTIPPPDGDTPEFAMRVAAEGVLIGALESRASQADLITAGENRYGVSLLVDGVRQPGGEPDARGGRGEADRLLEAGGGAGCRRPPSAPVA
jgi:hypothetical protein